MKSLDDGPGVNEVFQNVQGQDGVKATRFDIQRHGLDIAGPDPIEIPLGDFRRGDIQLDAGRPPAKTLVFQVL